MCKKAAAALHNTFVLQVVRLLGLAGRHPSNVQARSLQAPLVNHPEFS
jgi:hypothetical protein